MPSSVKTMSTTPDAEPSEACSLKPGSMSLTEAEAETVEVGEEVMLIVGVCEAPIELEGVEVIEDEGVLVGERVGVRVSDGVRVLDGVLDGLGVPEMVGVGEADCGVSVAEGEVLGVGVGEGAGAM
jgi:hypothetical protein